MTTTLATDLRRIAEIVYRCPDLFTPADYVALRAAATALESLDWRGTGPRDQVVGHVQPSR